MKEVYLGPPPSPGRQAASSGDRVVACAAESYRWLGWVRVEVTPRRRPPLVRDGLASVLPMQHPAPDRPWVLEICPASTVKREGLPTSCKGKADGPRRVAREVILRTLEGTGRLVVESEPLRALILDDPGGDALDGLIAAYAVFRALWEPAGLVTGDGDCRIEGYVYV